MGKFIEEVAKVNQNSNYKIRYAEEKENVKNELYKYFYREFKKRYKQVETCEDVEKTYIYFLNLSRMRDICYDNFDFGPHVKMEFIETTYQKELDKVYKMFKKQAKAQEKLIKMEETESAHFYEDIEEKPIKKNSIADIILCILAIPFLLFLGFRALIGILAVLFVILIILFS